jgi:hypothetical protein
MPKFALMGGNIVQNIIAADDLADAQNAGVVIEFTDANPAGIGWIYDEETKTFTPPAEETNA